MNKNQKTRSQAAKKAWETRRKNSATQKKTINTLKGEVKPRVIVFDIPKGAKRVTVLPGYETVKFS